MNKKVFLVFIIMVAISQVTYSQFKFGIRGGINSSTVKADDFLTNDNKITYPKNASMGFHFGVVSQIKIFNVFIQPEVLLTTNKNDMTVEDLVSGEKSELIQTFNKLDIPVLLGIKFGPAKIEAGPVATILLKSSSELFDVASYEEKFKSAVFGYQAGIGLEVSKLAVELKYEGDLTRFGDGINVGGERLNFDSRLSQWIVTVGIFF
ncbi:MAG: PorT family protein [Bacteroidales bacterium]|nr:PorT family protein [Bacteroidales bacterium]